VTLTTPGRGNVGAQLILRTGTRPFIRDFLRHVRAGGYQLDPERGLTYGREVVAHEEEEIFLALGLEFIPPAERIEFLPTPLFEAVPL
jgi:DNA polymerase/3'-5' exonuclease PolX